MLTIPEIRQALAAAVEAAKAANGTITKASADLRTAADADKPTATAAVTAATKAYDAAHAQARDLADELKRAEESEALSVKSATPRGAPEGTLGAVPATAKSSQELIKSIPARKMIVDIMVAHTKGAIEPDKWLRTTYGDDTADFIKSQQLSSYATGGALSLPDFAQTIIEGLEHMTVVRKMNPQVLSVPGSMIIPRETSAPSGGWMGENNNPTPGTFGFGDIKLDPKRLPIETVISRRLLDVAARGGAAVRNLEGYIVKRLREKTAVNEDAGFLRGAGTEFVPTGIRFQAAAGNVKASSGSTQAQIDADLRAMPLGLTTADIMITEGYWIMSPRTKTFLAGVRNTNGFQIYPSIDEKNTLLGYPIMDTNQVPTNLSGTNTEIMFVNGPSIIIANGSDVEMIVSTEGSYQSGNQHFSLIQRNEMLIHMEMYSDCKLERNQAISVLTGVSY
ncbi:MAG: phage major capsid protein family [Rhodospirillales bacterium]|nr:phage major capsid protein family [Rhodospirillales bacterium]